MVLKVWGTQVAHGEGGGCGVRRGEPKAGCVPAPLNASWGGTVMSEGMCRALLACLQA